MEIIVNRIRYLIIEYRQMAENVNVLNGNSHHATNDFKDFEKRNL